VADSDPLEQLRLGTVRAVASVRLLLEGFVEPAALDPSLATVALHQTLSTIASAGGIRPAAAHRAICGRDSYLAMEPGDYADLLRGAGRQGVDLLEQSSDGLLMLGAAGERMTDGRDFYAVFQTDDEWRLVSSGRTLGTVPISNVLGIGSLVGFAGRRWRVEAVDDRGKVLEVLPHSSGRLPKFDPVTGEAVHGRLSATMRMILEDGEEPSYADPQARAFLMEARSAYRRLRLDEQSFFEAGGDAYLMTWAGTAVNDLLAILVQATGLECEANDVGIVAVECGTNELARLLASVTEFPSVESLSGFVENLRSAKLDEFIDGNLLRRLWAARNVPVREEAITVLAEVLDRI
jgi:ATP-dependent Lhr-like helicase